MSTLRGLHSPQHSSNKTFKPLLIHHHFEGGTFLRHLASNKLYLLHPTEKKNTSVIQLINW